LYRLRYYATGSKFFDQLQEELEKTPEDVRLYRLLGDAYSSRVFGRQNFPEAVTMYQGGIGSAPKDTDRLARGGEIKTVINYLMKWEVANYQRYDWSKNNVCKVFHSPFGWTSNPNKWRADWRQRRESVIAQLLLKYNSPMKQTFAILADEDNYPILYYCRGGADRSVIMTSLLYLALGVPEEQILKTCLKFCTRYRAPHEQQHILKTVFYNVNKFGGINGYLRHISVPAEHVKNFRRNMLIKN